MILLDKQFSLCYNLSELGRKRINSRKGGKMRMAGIKA